MTFKFELSRKLLIGLLVIKLNDIIQNFLKNRLFQYFVVSEDTISILSEQVFYF